MSTYWYLECMDHTPPLRSNDEVEQHTYGLPEIRELCARRDTLTAESIPEGYFERGAARFLLEHPKCHLQLVSEYGDVESVDMPAELVPQHPAEDAFGITHGVTVEQAVGLAASLVQTLNEAVPTIRRLEGVIEQKAIEESK